MLFNTELELYSFHWYCGRSGSLEGLFLATPKEIGLIIDQNIYFGEVLGKHSDVHGIISDKDISKIDINIDARRALFEHCGKNISGYNPINYLSCEGCGDILEDCSCKCCELCNNSKYSCSCGD